MISEVLAKRDAFRVEIRQRALERDRRIVRQQMLANSQQSAIREAVPQTEHKSEMEENEQDAILLRLQKCMVSYEQESSSIKNLQFQEELLRKGCSPDALAKIENILFKISVSEQIWDPNLIDGFMKILSVGLERGIKSMAILVNASECCLFMEKKQILYEAFISSNLIKKVGSKEGIFHILKVFENFYYRCPVIKHPQHQLYDYAFSQICEIGARIATTNGDGCGSPLVSTYLCVFVSMLTRLNNKQRKRFLANMLVPKNCQAVSKFLDGFSVEWELKARLRVFELIKGLFQDQNSSITVFYILAPCFFKILTSQLQQLSRKQFEKYASNNLKKRVRVLFVEALNNLLMLYENGQYPGLLYIESRGGIDFFHSLLKSFGFPLDSKQANQHFCLVVHQFITNSSLQFVWIREKIIEHLSNMVQNFIMHDMLTRKMTLQGVLALLAREDCRDGGTNSFYRIKTTISQVCASIKNQQINDLAEQIQELLFDEIE